MAISQTSIKRLEKQAKQIKDLQATFANFSDEQLKQAFNQLRQDYQDKKITNEQLIDPVYAIVCETAKRVLQKDPYIVQVMGAICLNSGDVAAMATGEGKTLASTMPAVLNAITHKSVHIATANEYLAKRDFDEMRRVYNFLGLSVGVVYSGQDIPEKQQAYSCDITYGTGSEFGFDYLRDKLVTSDKYLSNQRHGFAIVDEVDSILIDEATIPMIISEKLETPVKYYNLADNFVKGLSPQDYEIDSKTNSIHLSDSGIEKIEKELNVDFKTGKNFNLLFYVNNALTAHYILKNNVDYKVEDGKILLIDRHSGRIMEGREYSNQLQQAIQTKENVPIQIPTKTKASISFQKYYTKYKKLSGMTGTTQNTEDEFFKIYNMFVYKIPTNKPCARKDEDMQIYVDKEKQHMAILAEIKEAQRTGRPILIGTTTIEQSEELAKLLKDNNIPCNVLNANTKKEADIVSCAGMLNQVTIATNVAGRGTDIKLGGDPEKLTLMHLERQNIFLNPKEQAIVFARNFDSPDMKLAYARNLFLDITQKCKQQKQVVNSLGGLRVIATTLSENQRIKNQLIGRSGRQGDNGSSIVMVSLDDTILNRFLGEEIEEIKKEYYKNMRHDGLLNDRMLTKLLTRAETLCNSLNEQYRDTNIKFENILDPIRTQVYKTRTELLKSRKITENIQNYIYYVVKNKLDSTNNVDKINEYLKDQFKSFAPTINQSMLSKKDILAQKITEKIIENRKNLLDKINSNPYNKKYLNQILLREKNTILKNLDFYWAEFLNSVEQLQQQAFLQAYAQKDPFTEFLFSSANKFEEIADSVKESSTKEIFEFLEYIKKLEQTKQNNVSLAQYK